MFQENLQQVDWTSWSWNNLNLKVSWGDFHWEKIERKGWQQKYCNVQWRNCWRKSIMVCKTLIVCENVLVMVLKMITAWWKLEKWFVSSVLQGDNTNWRWSSLFFCVGFEFGFLQWRSWWYYGDWQSWWLLSGSQQTLLSTEIAELFAGFYGQTENTPNLLHYNM